MTTLPRTFALVVSSTSVVDFGRMKAVFHIDVLLLRYVRGCHKHNHSASPCDFGSCSTTSLGAAAAAANKAEEKLLVGSLDAWLAAREH